MFSISTSNCHVLPTTIKPFENKAFISKPVLLYKHSPEIIRKELMKNYKTYANGNRLAKINYKFYKRETDYNNMQRKNKRSERFNSIAEPRIHTASGYR